MPQKPTSAEAPLKRLTSLRLIKVADISNFLTHGTAHVISWAPHLTELTIQGATWPHNSSTEIVSHITIRTRRTYQLRLCKSLHGTLETPLHEAAKHVCREYALPMVEEIFRRRGGLYELL